MSYEILYFGHLAALALWLGALVATVILTGSALAASGGEQRTWGLRMAYRIALWVVSPAALVVLGAGVAMVIQSGMVGSWKPLWFTIMERGGGTVALLSFGLMLFLGARINRVAIDGAPADVQKREGRRFMGAALGIATGVLGVILAVSLRLN